MNSSEAAVARPVPQDRQTGEAPSRGRVLAVANQKGGVGKTTTAINLATALAIVGKKLLVVDLDPQGNASTGFGISRDGRTAGTYGMLIDGVPLADVAMRTEIRNLEIVPATIDLSAAEIEIANLRDPQRRLRRALQPVAARYDYILIDCPPALGLLTINGLAAADAVIVPLQCEFLPLEGLGQLMDTIEQVRASFNPVLELQGILLTMHDSRNRLTGEVSANVRGYFGDRVFDTVIPRNVTVSEAPSHGKPALLYDLNCAGSRAYAALAGEILRRGRP